MRKISRRSFLKAATVACALTALTACGGGDESAAVSVAKDENGAYVDTLTITLGRFAEPSAAALFPEGQTFEDNAYTRYIESKLNVDLVGKQAAVPQAERFPRGDAAIRKCHTDTSSFVQLAKDGFGLLTKKKKKFYDFYVRCHIKQKNRQTSRKAATQS